MHLRYFVVVNLYQPYTHSFAWIRRLCNGGGVCYHAWPALIRAREISITEVCTRTFCQSDYVRKLVSRIAGARNIFHYVEQKRF